MKIAVLSGKGGAGKTLVSVNLAAAANKSVYIDCDVEEPNGHLFFKPESVKSSNVYVKLPEVNEKRCNGCRICVDFCKYNALAYTQNRLMIFDEVCHHCGGCILFCPEKALKEGCKIVGEVQEGQSENVRVITGVMDIGVASGIPIIKELSKAGKETNGPTFIDCPPGSSCIVMESIKDVDYCIMVAEPTLFGVHNLRMVYELVKLFEKPYGVILNKCQEGDNPAEKFCIEKGINILGRIPFDGELGTMNSKALISARESAKYRDLFTSLLQAALKEVQHEATIDPQR